MSVKPSIGDFVATDDSGGFVNLKTGEVLDAGAMLRLFSGDELLQVPVGRRPLPRSSSRTSTDNRHRLLGSRRRDEARIPRGQPIECLAHGFGCLGIDHLNAPFLLATPALSGNRRRDPRRAPANTTIGLDRGEYCRSRTSRL